MDSVKFEKGHVRYVRLINKRNFLDQEWALQWNASEHMGVCLPAFPNQLDADDAVAKAVRKTSDSFMVAFSSFFQFQKGVFVRECPVKLSVVSED